MVLDPRQLPSVMDCGEFERSVEAFVDGEFEAPEQAQAEAHLEGCATCRARAETAGRARDALRAALRSAMGPTTPAGRAPAALRARVEASLARRRRPLWRRVLSPLPVATAAACAAGVAVVLFIHAPDDRLVQDAVRRHHLDLPLDVTTATVAADSIPGWLAGRLDFKPTPPRFKRQDVRMVGARLTQVRDLPAAYIRYELPRGQAGLFIVDDPHRRFESPGRDVQVGPATVRMVSARGYNVATWRQDEIVYSLVSDLDEDALFQLVRASQAR